jgi:hypothetical protein
MSSSKHKIVLLLKRGAVAFYKNSGYFNMRYQDYRNPTYAEIISRK